jgi:hypothetical protein
MNENNERMMILKMIEEGTVSADEGAKLLASVESAPSKSHQKTPQRQGDAKWFRVRVTDTITGKSKATVSLPLSLMDWGLRVGAQFAPEVANLDLGELSEILSTGLEGKIVDVLDEVDGEHVEIYVE